jgi:GTP-binding protein
MSTDSDARFLTSANRPEQFLPDEGTEVAFAGRSNCGKSSAINVILRRRNLARTSKTPGRTQLVNFFGLGPQRRVVDLPGYGFARVPTAVQDHWRELLERYFVGRRSLGGLFLMVDSRRGLTDFDRQMLGWMEALRHPVHVLLTKCDKLGRKERTDTLATATAAIGEGDTIQLFSAKTSEGVSAARQRMEEMLANRRKPR